MPPLTFLQLSTLQASLQRQAGTQPMSRSIQIASKPAQREE